jgi:hypothetical protein
MADAMVMVLLLLPREVMTWQENVFHVVNHLPRGRKNHLNLTRGMVGKPTKTIDGGRVESREQSIR